MRILIALLLFAIAFQAQAKTFRNAYISFEMQDNWNCKLEQTEWVCRAQDPQEAKEAVIIVAAKEKGPLDNFLLYENHLNGPVSTVGRNGVAMVSTVKYKAQNKKLMIKSGLMACMATVRFKTILPATWQR